MTHTTSRAGPKLHPTHAASRAGHHRKGRYFAVFLVLEAAVFAILPLSARVPVRVLLPAHAAITAALLVAALVLRRSGRGAQLWPVLYALFVAGCAVLLSTLFSGSVVARLHLRDGSPAWVAAAKLSESLWRVIPILLLMALVRAKPRSLYLGSGKLATGLAIGFIGFAVLALLAFVPVAQERGGPARLLELLPWILVFVFANGVMEELLFRGLLLKGYETFLGKELANLLAAIVFTLVHVQVAYVADLLQFLVIVFPLALLWGHLMQKTGSLWGSALFHAGADCVIVLGIFSSM